MPALGLLDAFVIFFLWIKVKRAKKRSLGDSLHDLIALILIISLFWGFGLAASIRRLTYGVADNLNLLSGLGSRLLLIIAAWYVLHFFKHKMAYVIENMIPEQKHQRLSLMLAFLSGLLLSIFILWFFQSWFGQEAGILLYWIRSLIMV